MAYSIKQKQKINTRYRDMALVFTLAVTTGTAVSYWLYRHNLRGIAPAQSSNSTPSAAEEEPLHVVAPVQEQVQTDTEHDVSIPPVQNGLAPVLSTLKTKQPVVFLGIDDGAAKQASELQMMKDNNVRASLFLANRFMSGNSAFFKDFIPAGSIVEDHTMNHKLLSKLTLDEQKAEICGQADIELKQFGRRPVLFRPPGGDYNTDTQRAAAACGMKAVVLWIAKANGGTMQYQVGHKLRPGDIVLMHFRPEFAKDLQAFLDASKAAGLHTELLENWM